jgi:aerobic-type carbon monoxide dehydrogenase small subunit (CoxS/CutS family)
VSCMALAAMQEGKRITTINKAQAVQKTGRETKLDA